MPIEEIEDLDGHLSAIVDAIAKLRGREHTALLGRCKVRSNRCHFAHRLAQEKMIVRHLIDATQSRRKLEQATNVGFLDVKQISQVTRTWRTETRLPLEERSDVS